MVWIFTGPDACQITVTFTNGKTEKIPIDVAVWTPDPVYDRLTLELKMPKEARLSLQTTESYPKRNLPGYPTSGAEATPDEYPPPPSFGWDYDPVFMESRPWQHPYVPSPAMLYRKEDVTTSLARSTVKSEDIHKLIPGMFIIYCNEMVSCWKILNWILMDLDRVHWKEAISCLKTNAFADTFIHLL